MLDGIDITETITRGKIILFLDGVDFNDCPSIPLLPLVHTSNTLDGKMYIDTEKITKPQKRCENFEDNPVYLFYGKPAYRCKNEKTGDAGELMMVFILKDYPKISSDIIRVYPLDTGALSHGFYDGYKINSWSFDNFKQDFMMNTDIKQLPKHVSLFWDNNNGYFRYFVAPKFDKISVANSCVIEAFLELITSKSTTIFDDRCAVVEVHSEVINSLLDHIQAIVVADTIFTDEEKGVLESRNIIVREYPTFGRHEPKEDYTLILNTVLEYYTEIGII